MKILIAEDEGDMRKILRLYLEKEGYEVEAAADGNEAFEKLCDAPFDLVIADWMMPGMSGIELLQKIRDLSIPVKTLMLTAKGEAEDEIRGLTCGADDYVRKPFEPKVLLLRVAKLLQAGRELKCGTIVLNPGLYKVSAKGKEIMLTPKEFKLLETLLLNKGITLSRETLLNRVWGDDYDGEERTLDTHIRRLRSKIGKEYITTFVGVGYRMDECHE